MYNYNTLQNISTDKVVALNHLFLILFAWLKLVPVICGQLFVVDEGLKLNHRSFYS